MPEQTRGAQDVLPGLLFLGNYGQGRGDFSRLLPLPCRPMRTTLDIDDTVLTTAKQLARARGHTIGMVISELARRALENNRPARHAYRQFPVFDVPADAAALSVECVEAIIANEGVSARR